MRVAEKQSLSLTFNKVTKLEIASRKKKYSNVSKAKSLLQESAEMKENLQVFIAKALNKKLSLAYL